MDDHRDELSPCYSWFIRDWRASHRAGKLSWKERGFYRECLDWSWDLNGLPNDKEAIRDLLHATRGDFQKLWPLASQFYVVAPDGRLRNPRQEAERAKQHRRRDLSARGGAAKAGGNGSPPPVVPDGSAGRQAETAVPDGSAEPTALHLHTHTPVHLPVPVHVHTDAHALEPADEAFESFKAAYPASRRQGGHMAAQLYVAASGRVGTTALLVALEQHTRSAQWLVDKVIPNMLTWLQDEHWTRELPPPAAFGTSVKTAGNVDAAKRFVERHR